MTKWAGKVVAITGAGSGIGRALAIDLSGRGVRLALSDRNLGDVQATAGLCVGDSVRADEVDVRDAEAVLAWADRVVDEFGAVHVVINNAGVALTGDIVDISLADMKWVLDTDFWGVVHGTKAFLPHLIASGDGHVVNVSSVFGLIAVPSQSAYNAAKFAVRGFTEALRQEMLVAGHPVAVTCVLPGGIRTNVVRNSRVVGFDQLGLIDRFDRLLAHTSAQRAAATIIRGVGRGRSRVLVGPDAHLIDVLVRVLGPGYQRVVAATFGRVGGSSRVALLPASDSPLDSSATPLVETQGAAR